MQALLKTSTQQCFEFSLIENIPFKVWITIRIVRVCFAKTKTKTKTKAKIID